MIGIPIGKYFKIIIIFLDETRMITWLFALIPIGLILKFIKIPLMRFAYSFTMGIFVSFSLYKEGYILFWLLFIRCFCNSNLIIYCLFLNYVFKKICRNCCLYRSFWRFRIDSSLKNVIRYFKFKESYF